MKIEDAEKLETGQKVIHNRYGECSVKEVIISMGDTFGSMGELFGVVITPITETGRELLRLDCGCDIPDYLEDSVRRISVENPGYKPIDQETAWGTSAEDLPEQEQKDYFAPKDEEVSSEERNRSC